MSEQCGAEQSSSRVPKQWGTRVAELLSNRAWSRRARDCRSSGAPKCRRSWLPGQYSRVRQCSSSRATLEQMQRDAGAVWCLCSRAPERRRSGAPESLERYRAGAAGCRCSGALERLNSSVPVQQSARATERWSNGAAGRRGTSMSKPRYRPCKSFTTYHLLRITF